MRRLTIVGAHVVFHRMLDISPKRSLCAVLLCKRTLDAPVHPGYWGLFGGRLEVDEEPKRGVLREIHAELAIPAAKLALSNLCDVHIRRSKESGDALGLRYFSSPLELEMDRLTLKRSIKDQKVEGQGLGWFTAEEIHHMLLRPEDRIAIGAFFQRNGI